MPISIMTEKAWFGHNVNFLQHKIELSDKYDIVLCCKSSLYELLKNEFYTLSFPFKNIKIGIISMDMEEFLLFFQNENNLGTLLIIVDFENVSLEYYQKSNQDAIANNWIFVHPSLSWNQLYFTQLDADLKEGIKKIRFLGHQAHVTPSQILEFAQNHSIEILRLGQIRQTPLITKVPFGVMYGMFPRKTSCSIVLKSTCSSSLQDRRKRAFRGTENVNPL